MQHDAPAPAAVGQPEAPRAWLRSEQSADSPHRTFVEALQAAVDAERALGGPMLTFHLGRSPQPLPAAELRDGAARWASRLARAGVAPGDRVPLLLPTGPEFVRAYFGVLWRGAVPVPLSSPMTFGGADRYVANLARVVADCGARVMVLSERMAKAAAAEERLADRIEAMLLPGEADAEPPADPVPVDPAATALLQYTSGTTGDPKGVVVSHRALLANAAAIRQGLGLQPRDVGVSWLPMFHDMGLIGVLLTCVAHPYRLHLMRPESFVMRPGRWLELMSELGATLTAAPNFAYALASGRRGRTDGPLDLSRLRRALNGSEPVHASTVRAFQERFAGAGLPPHASMPVYGLAEATLAVTFCEPGAPLRALQLDRRALQEQGLARPFRDGERTEVVSVGRPVAGAQVRVRREDGSVAREGEVGEIEVGGPSLMDGYYGRPEASAEVLVDGWLRTGDLGFVQDGELFVVGRRKEVVIKGGRNVYPYDVERVAAEAGGLGAAAFGLPDPEAGTDRLVLVVEARARDEAERQALARRVQGDVLAVLGVKVDEVRIWPVGALPRTTSGKIRRGEVAARIAAETRGEGAP